MTSGPGVRRVLRRSCCTRPVPWGSQWRDPGQRQQSARPPWGSRWPRFAAWKDAPSLARRVLCSGCSTEARTPRHRRCGTSRSYAHRRARDRLNALPGLRRGRGCVRSGSALVAGSSTDPTSTARDRSQPPCQQARPLRQCELACAPPIVVECRVLHGAVVVR